MASNFLKGLQQQGLANSQPRPLGERGSSLEGLPSQLQLPQRMTRQEDTGNVQSCTASPPSGLCWLRPEITSHRQEVGTAAGTQATSRPRPESVSAGDSGAGAKAVQWRRGRVAAPGSSPPHKERKSHSSVSKSASPGTSMSPTTAENRTEHAAGPGQPLPTACYSGLKR